LSHSDSPNIATQIWTFLQCWGLKPGLWV
jgi:hypothetical protein